ncbi:MAG: helix-turn-helix transcriptional regulator [Clostridia bacterium]|nr:helix-turn-helix transcriptional regulator [Clostridia bacterium]
MARKYIDWIKTGKKLEALRKRNETFIKKVCFLTKGKQGDCNLDCKNCIEDMDNYISRVELAMVFGVTEHVVNNWEKGDTPLPVDELLYYAELSEKSIEDILVYF